MTKLQRQLVALHKQLCRELGIKPVPVEFRPIRSNGYYEWGTKIVINLAKCKKRDRDPFFIMAHETRHHYQWCQGWTGYIIKRGVLHRKWKNKSCTVTYYKNVMRRLRKLRDETDYLALPWERDANQYAAFISDAFDFQEGYPDDGH